MIESLVQAHPIATRVAEHGDGSHGVDDLEHDMSEDIVRGKGKGRVILLHGKPGVGKTSTAELLAEATRRPLFALTCGELIVFENADYIQQRTALTHLCS